jgi:hypothetical protein
MRKLSFWLAAAAVLGACDQDIPTASNSAAAQPSFLRTAEHTTTVDPFEATTQEECVGELVTFVGEVRTTVNSVSDPDGNGLHVTSTSITHAIGIGQTTGTKYLWQDASRISFDTPSIEAPHGTFTSQDVFRVVSQGPVDNLVFVFDQHTTVTGTGVEKLTVDNLRIECVG